MDYKLFDDDSVKLSKLNINAIPRYTQLSDRVCAQVMQLDLSNQAIHQRWDFDFTSDGCINQTHPNIGADATDKEGYIQTYR